MLGLLAVVVVIAALIRRRWTLLRDVFLAALITIALGLLMARVVQGSWSLDWGRFAAGPDADWVPWLRLMIPASIILVAKPHLVRPMRRAGWWLLALATMASVLLGLSPSLAVASVLMAVVAGSAVHLVLGSVRGRPDLDDLAAALTAFGVKTRSLGVSERQPAGVFVLEAEDEAGEPLEVKVYGRDAYDTQLLTTMWRTVWFRRPDSPSSPGRLQQVEHEAFLTLLAAQIGVLTQRVVTAGLTPTEDAILVLGGVSGFRVASSGWAEEDVARMWEMLAGLHAARIAHGQVDGEHLISDGARAGLIDFRSATISHDPWHRLIDRAQALVTSVLAVGTGPGVRLAKEALGADELAEVLPFLQADPLTPSQRRELRQADVDIDGLRGEVAGSIGIEPPELQRLRRVTWGSLLKTILPVLAFLALAGVVAGLDLEDLADSLEEASWWFVAVGLIVSQIPRLFQAISALGASPIAVPLSRLYVLQLAQAYIALTIPGAAARVAMNVRFFQRHGLPPGTSLAVGALDSFAGFLSQLILLTILLLFTSATLDLDLDGGTTSGLLRLVALVAAAALIALLVVFAVPRLRRLVLGRLRELGQQAIGAIRGIASPRRLGFLFGGNLANEVLMAVGLGAFVVALGQPIGLGELIFINVTVSLLAGLIPIPGGIGVVEGGLMLGLARAGMPEELAFAAAILFRFATFYLPPAWGFFAFRWLERNKHL
jgi:uncharacterized membrane protein YbhN (UPF0104 family)